MKSSRSNDSSMLCSAKIRLLAGGTLMIFACSSLAMAADPAREVLVNRINSLRSQIQNLDSQISELERKMPGIEASIEQLTERLGSLQIPQAKEQEAEPAKDKPQAVGFRPPILQFDEKKEAPIIVVCQNGKVMIADIDEGSAALDVIMKDQAKLKAFVANGGGTLPAGDFNLQLKFNLSLGIPDIQEEFVARPGQTGELLEMAVQPSSKLNQRLSRIVPGKAVIQFAVYPDSFDAFRSVRSLVWNQKHSINWIPQEHGTNIRGGGRLGHQ